MSDQIRQLWYFAEFVVEYHLDRVGIDARDETGAVSTETAVLTAGLVIVAGAAIAILWERMNSNAESIPDTPTFESP